LLSSNEDSLVVYIEDMMAAINKELARVKSDHVYSRAIADFTEAMDIGPQHVQAIYPASTMQEEMIFSTLMDPARRCYIVTYHFDTVHDIRLAELNDALHALAYKHSALRSIACWDADTGDGNADSVTMIVLDPDYIGSYGTRNVIEVIE
jgi:hypothetical protein